MSWRQEEEHESFKSEAHVFLSGKEFVDCFNLSSFNYLGSVITGEGPKPEILSRIAQATAALTRLKPVWNDRSISLSSKIRLMRSLVTSISCMLVNHGPLQQSPKEEYKPWKWDATARYYASHTKTMLPTRKSVPGSSRQSDHTNTSWPSKRNANCSGTVMSPVHQVRPKQSCKAQWKGKEDKADRGRGGKTTSGNGQAWRSVGPRGQWRTGGHGGNWLRNCLWSPNDPRGLGIDDGDEIVIRSSFIYCSLAGAWWCSRVGVSINKVLDDGAGYHLRRLERRW